MIFSYDLPTRLCFGTGEIRTLARLDAIRNRRVLLLCFPAFSRRKEITAELATSCSAVIPCDEFEENPSVALARRLAERIRKEAVEALVAIGGGSTLDAAKGATWFAANPEWMPDDDTGTVTETDLPIVAVPTTAGTGSEVTPYAILTDVEGNKRILKHRSITPRWAICDPELTLSMPDTVTAHTGLDALCHAIEGYCARSCRGLLADLALASVRRGAAALPALRNAPADEGLRSEMMLAALEAGVVLAHCGTIVVHALGYGISRHSGFPHGLANALLFPAFLEVLEERGSERARSLIEFLDGDPHGFVRRCGVDQTLPDTPPELLEEWTAAAAASYGCPNCTTPIGRDEIAEILRRSMPPGGGRPREPNRTSATP